MFPNAKALGKYTHSEKIAKSYLRGKHVKTLCEEQHTKRRVLFRIKRSKLPFFLIEMAVLNFADFLLVSDSFAFGFAFL